MKKITLRFYEEQLLKDFKIQCVKDETTMQEVLLGAVKRFVTDKENKICKEEKYEKKRL